MSNPDSSEPDRKPPSQAISVPAEEEHRGPSLALMYALAALALAAAIAFALMIVFPFYSRSR